MSNLPALYELAGEYAEASSKLADMGMDEQTIIDTLEGLSGDLQTKATNCAMFIRNLEATADAIREAEGQMAVRRKAIASRADHVRGYLLSNMERCGISKIESPHLSLIVKKNPPSVVIDAPGQIPSDLYIYPDAPAPYPDKKAISERLKAGEIVTGAHLQSGVRLEIK